MACLLSAARRLSLSLGNAASKPSTRSRFMSTNCRDKSARPFFVVTAADRMTMVKLQTSRKKQIEAARGWLACRTPEIPWLTTQIISVRAPSEQTLRHGPPALPRGR